MRELTGDEVQLVAGGLDPSKPEHSEEVSNGGAPLGSRTAGEYFSKCMTYTSPSATTSSVWSIAGAMNRYVGIAGAAYGPGQVVVWGVGTIQ